MKNFYVLTDALEYIEKSICEDFESQAVADYCGVSLSSLQKLFRLALHRSVRDYIQRRRICLAAKDILHSEMKMIDIAYNLDSRKHVTRNARNTDKYKLLTKIIFSLCVSS